MIHSLVYCSDNVIVTTVLVRSDLLSCGYQFANVSCSDCLYQRAWLDESASCVENSGRLMLVRN